MLSFALSEYCGGILGTSSVTDYFFQSNLAGQVIVVILLVLSVVAWGIMFCKKADLTSMRDLNVKTERKLSEAPSVVDASASKAISGPYASLLRAAVKAWLGCRAGGNSAQLRHLRLSQVENAITRSISRQTMKYESKMTLLGTVISGAPFLGLLGTVWGVMDCFGSLSGQTSVTLQNLAPGVAGALLTTVAGLLVAIPSVFGYNYLTTVEANMTTELENFATLVADRIEMESQISSENEAPENLGPDGAGIPLEPAGARAAPIPSGGFGDAKSASANPRVINFSLDDDDDDSSRPTLTREFED